MLYMSSFSELQLRKFVNSSYIFHQGPAPRAQSQRTQTIRRMLYGCCGSICIHMTFASSSSTHSPQFRCATFCLLQLYMLAQVLSSTTLREELYRPLNFNTRSDWDCQHLICHALPLHPLPKAPLPLVDTHISELQAHLQ